MALTAEHMTAMASLTRISAIAAMQSMVNDGMSVDEAREVWAGYLVSLQAMTRPEFHRLCQQLREWKDD